MMKPTSPQIRRGGTYPQEFREEAVCYWLSSGQTLASVSSDLGLTPETLRSWHRQMKAESSQSPSKTSAMGSSTSQGTSQDLSLAREVGQLKKELEAMTRQRDILDVNLSGLGYRSANEKETQAGQI